jgi:hypothetical protein
MNACQFFFWGGGRGGLFLMEFALMAVRSGSFSLANTFSLARMFMLLNVFCNCIYETGFVKLKKKLGPGGKTAPHGVTLIEEDSTIFGPRKVVKAHHHVSRVSLKSPGRPSAPRKPRTTRTTGAEASNLFFVRPRDQTLVAVVTPGRTSQ